jgi:hypothetical protein
VPYRRRIGAGNAHSGKVEGEEPEQDSEPEVAGRESPAPRYRPSHLRRTNQMSATVSPTMAVRCVQRIPSSYIPPLGSSQARLQIGRVGWPVRARIRCS